MATKYFTSADDGAMPEGHYVYTEGGVAMISPKRVSQVEVAPTFFVVLDKPMPSRWVRFWQKLLLGWVWSKPAP